MEGILPDKVRWRTSRGHVSELIEHGLRDKEKTMIDVLLQETRNTQSEYLSPEKLMSAWQKYQEGTSLADSPLLTPVALQAWLRSR